MLNPPRGLLSGVPTLVGESINATGVSDVRLFSVSAPPGQSRTVKCQAVGTFTVFDGNLEVSMDGGTTYSTFVAFDFVASAVFIFDVTPGVLYRFNISNITQSVAPNIYATLN